MAYKTLSVIAIAGIIFSIFLQIDMYNEIQETKNDIKEIQSKYPHINWALINNGIVR